MARTRKTVPNKGGRPAYSRTELIKLLDAYTDGPGTIQELVRHLGIGTTTFSDLMRDVPEFSEAVMRVRDRADDKVEASLYDRAIGYSYTETSRKTGVGKEGNPIDEETVHEKELVPDVGAQMNWLKNRRPDKWREKISVDVTNHALGAMVERMRKELDGDDA